MHAEMEATNWVVRVFEEGNSHRDPYVLSVVAIKVDRNIVAVYGLDKALSKEGFKALVEVFYGAGFKSAIFTRYRNGQEFTHAIDLRKYHANDFVSRHTLDECNACVCD